MRGPTVGAAVFAAMVATMPAEAQDSGTGLAGLLLRFFSPNNPVILKDNPVPAFSHKAHFVSQPNAQAILGELNAGIATQIATFPVGSSSAGFTFTFDSNLGVYNRTTQSFGPLFAERPQTAGKGKFSFGINYQDATYDRFEGRDLKNGDIKLDLRHLDVNNDVSLFNPWFEGDVIQSNLFLDLESKTTVFFANYGVSEKFDLGVAIPYVDISMNARIEAGVVRLATAPDPFVIHIFPDDKDTHTFTESGSANGLGDILIRGKYHFLSKPSFNLAGALDLRLPTGKEEDLLGSGATQTKVFLAASGGGGRVVPRANAGYTFSSGGSSFTGDLPNEFNYNVGLDLVPHHRVSVLLDFVGRTLLDTNRLVETDQTFTYRFRTDPTPQTTVRPELTTRQGNLNLMLGSAGIKFNPAGRLLIVGNVLFSIGKNGLQDKLTPVIGIDYTF
jgi:hypothetical protein